MLSTFSKLFIHLYLFTGVPETPKAGAGLPTAGRDASVVAGIVVAAFSVIIIVAAVVSLFFFSATCCIPHI